MSCPTDRVYFILDSKLGSLYLFDSLTQDRPSEKIVIAQCLLNVKPEFTWVNEDLERKFELQPMAPNNEPIGDLL